MILSLTNRTALVTGASAGLGRHFAGVLAAAGARVALAARRRESLDAAVAEIEAAGGQAIAVPLDVTDAASVRNGVREAAGALGGLDILVNNAGATVAKPALDYAEEEWDRVIDTNLKGAFLTAQETARVMREQGRGGSIVNIASILGLRVAGHVVAYTASKAGLVQMTQALALEWARYGIRVNALAPGYMETDLNRDFLATDAGQALIRRVPQRRLGRLADLNGPLLLLCSDASAYMTGAVVPVDGGHLVSTL
ncbi:SDR family oxidoreductase [Azospirillum brasilense]|uniref:SDR family NAD(P)-dependent oxidoreductase n=1 Tax=Azospirillum brasilense TaxID=192 RepID=A0A0P0F4F8_AZOBR|nr:MULTISPECIES: SDR family NAD(P)-dependent oxidoreductase [Azospirillum]ALJ35535.1 2-deoxy-D-gluconate 3-dehydrogenase [Azospirillum brasilense]MDW7555604.1 SDR family NAD(P)-dependent oxidoreductase [Azospirillum brasilense]MDW7595531.1 SDR family NAD(P)-dependent oxidoreductase [Azospirillum brasilense]MDW7630536.1 SDR family NAD(P)-dependent oxidoreductase [Azospirillum brasilense]MDX5954268.1 SDR family NAD(P)-dependent oxidoreductase [Azospirillum brasilense]